MLESVDENFGTIPKSLEKLLILFLLQLVTVPSATTR